MTVCIAFGRLERSRGGVDPVKYVSAHGTKQTNSVGRRNVGL
jgi:hypothetical protein